MAAKGRRIRTRRDLRIVSKQAGTHYQYRVVREWEGKQVFTHKKLLQINSPRRARTKTVDQYSDATGKSLTRPKDEQSAIGAAHRFCEQVDAGQRDAPVMEFRGLVVAKFKSSGTVGITAGQPEAYRRSRRIKGSTEWIRYVAPSGDVYNLHPKRHTLRS